MQIRFIPNPLHVETQRPEPESMTTAVIYTALSSYRGTLGPFKPIPWRPVRSLASATPFSSHEIKKPRDAKSDHFQATQTFGAHNGDSMISGYAHNGDSMKAIQLFEHQKTKGGC